jgi:hypothetical protein
MMNKCTVLQQAVLSVVKKAATSELLSGSAVLSLHQINCVCQQCQSYLTAAVCVSAGRQGAVVAVVQGQLVAMAAVTPAVDLQLLQDNFKLAEGLPPGCCSTAAAHAELDVCVVNPVFSKSVGALLAGAGCLALRAAAHYAAARRQHA